MFFLALLGRIANLHRVVAYIFPVRVMLCFNRRRLAKPVGEKVDERARPGRALRHDNVLFTAPPLPALSH